MVHIQFLDNYVWYTVITVDSSLVQFYMEQTKDNYPDKRVRAIDSDGRIVDIM